MRSILISVDKFDAWSMHTIEAIDIVNILLEDGWRVDVISSVAGKSMASELSRLAATERFTVITDSQGELSEFYDAIWIYRGYFSEKLLDAIAGERLDGPMIFRHFSDYHDLYIPYGVQTENTFAAITLGLSARTNAILLQTGITSSQLQTLPWTTPESFSAYSLNSRADNLGRVLYVAEEMTPEIYEVQQHAFEAGIQFEWFDLTAPAHNMPAEWLCGYDVVIGNQDIVPKALALGIPIFLVNGGYVEGYLNEDNLSAHEQDHFCGVTLRNCPDAQEWIALLQSGYAAASAWSQAQRHSVAQKWSLNRALARLLDMPLAAKKRKLDEKQRYALSFHSQAILAQQAPLYSMSRWLEDRQLTAARRSALLELSNAHPTIGRIGVVILDAAEDAAQLEKTRLSVTSQSLPAVTITTLPVGEAGIIRFNTWINEVDVQSIMVIPSGYVLRDDALLLIAEQQLRSESACLFYGDEMVRIEGEEPDMILRPQVNIDLLRSFPYVGQVLCFSREMTIKTGGLDARYPHAPFIDLLWRFVEIDGISALKHIPEVLVESPSLPSVWSKSAAVQNDCEQILLAHLQRLGITATLESGLSSSIKRIRYHWGVTPLVSIIIPTRDRFALLKRCIESLMEKTAYTRYELLIIDNCSADDDACRFLNDLAALGLEQVRILRYDAPFNFAEINNAAAQQARGDVLLFLNNDCEIIDKNWLDAMLEHALRPEVALVGARLEYQDGRIQHGGYLTGVQNGVEVAFEGMPGDSDVFQHYLQTPRNLTAVSASCMMVRKDVFYTLNGFNQETYPLYFADVDLGLRAQQQGYLNVWTPFARVSHMGGATRLMGQKINVQERPESKDYDALRRDWRLRLQDDPSYNPRMQKAGKPFTLSDTTARFTTSLPGKPLPVVLAHHVNWSGCGQYRILQPFKAMESHRYHEGGLINNVPGLMEAAQLEPDVILLQLITGSRFPEIIGQLREMTPAKIALEYDDYLLNVPLKNGNRQEFPQHMIKSFRKVMERADWIVVSTSPLADAYSRFHDDIRVAQNRLAPDQWGHLFSQRGVSKKPRVGWAGGSTHAGDLQILLPLIKALEGKIEWVFMGMKPQNVHCEFHPGVPFDMYPEKLASLNLDLALVPLEINQFNECKSNLRLLEIGTCGVPIIATDIEPFRCDLPVTLVENRYKDWMKAIQTHLADAAWRRAQGDALREAIHRDWYLRGEGLKDWRYAWLNAGS